MYIYCKFDLFFFRKTLKETSKDYLKISKSIYSLFESLKILYIIQPAYYVKWELLKRYFLAQLYPKLKEKGSIGASRAKQVESFILEILLKYFANLLCKRHFKLLLLLHSLILNTKYNESTTNNAKSKNTKDKHSQEHFNAFDLISKSLKQNTLQLLDQLNTKRPKPSYLSLNSWANLLEIERNYDSKFKDLSKSLIENEKKWIEYFQINFIDDESNLTHISEKEIDLLNDSPFNQSLNIHEKLMLWLCARPDKVS